MSDTFKIKRGVDIKLQGKAEQVYADAELPETFAVKPTDFPGARLKLAVREGDEVKAGSRVLFNKDREEVVITSPVSGEVAEIRRGAKRKLLEIRILADKENKYLDFGAADPATLDREAVKKKLLESGCWAFIKQRPYNILANPNEQPKAIFISCFDSVPLGIDYDFALHGTEKEFQAGIEAIKKLTEGDVHLGLNADSKPSSVFTECKGVKLHRFRGPHPAGNVGVQINRVDPINKGEYVWTLNPQQVVIIGRLFLTGNYDARINIPIAGSHLNNPAYHNTIMGASVKNFLEGNLKAGKSRIISGNVLTGTRITEDGYLGFFDQQLTVIPEGGEDQFFGWITPNFDKFSLSRTLFSWIMPNKAYNLDASMNGEERAFVITGEYEKVFPFDIYPTQLIKAIMVKDVEAMENLGIYEVVEEDFALCEVVCTSKIPVQQTVREGLDLMLQELGD